MRRRQSCGLLLILLLLLGGRVIRHRLLVGPDGHWRDPLWLDALLPAVAVATAEEPPPPRGPFAVNTVGVDTLCYMPGIGPKLAARIVAERLAAGPFRDLEDFQRVKGIGPKMAAKLASWIVFGAQLRTEPADTCGESMGPTRPATETRARDAPP